MLPNGSAWLTTSFRKPELVWYNIVTVVRLHLMSYVKLFAFLKDTYKAWRNSANSPPLAPVGVQMELNW